MKISLEQAQAIAKRVTKQMREWGFESNSIQPKFVILVALVVRELRAEAKRPNTQTTPDDESTA